MPTDSEPAAADRPTGPLYCDASALAKLFLPEVGSDELNTVVAGRSDLLISELAITEVASALARRARAGALGEAIARRVHRKVLAIVASGAFRRLDLLPETHREAERLLLAARSAPLRAADALHLALALTARASTILTYDRTLARAARIQGLAAWPDTVA